MARWNWGSSVETVAIVVVLIRQLPGKRSCSVTIVILEEPTEPLATAVNPFPERSGSLLLLRGAEDSSWGFHSIPLESEGMSTHCLSLLAWTLLMIMGGILREENFSRSTW